MHPRPAPPLPYPPLPGRQFPAELEGPSIRLVSRSPLSLDDLVSLLYEAHRHALPPAKPPGKENEATDARAGGTGGVSKPVIRRWVLEVRVCWGPSGSDGATTRRHTPREGRGLCWRSFTPRQNTVGWARALAVLIVAFLPNDTCSCKWQVAVHSATYYQSQPGADDDAGDPCRPLRGRCMHAPPRPAAAQVAEQRNGLWWAKPDMAVRYNLPSGQLQEGAQAQQAQQAQEQASKQREAAAAIDLATALHNGRLAAA